MNMSTVSRHVDISTFLEMVVVYLGRPLLAIMDEFPRRSKQPCSVIFCCFISRKYYNWVPFISEYKDQIRSLRKEVSMNIRFET